MAHAIICPQCNAPLSPHRFARSIVCSYCGTTVQLDEASVSAAIFREAFQAWNAPENHQVSAWVSIGDSHWALTKHLAHGHLSDVYAARRARWPTELAILKLLRDPKDTSQFDQEWETLQSLHRSEAPGAQTFTALIPQPIAHGTLGAGLHTGKRVSLFRWASGFRHTFDEVRQAYPQGIPPRASIWIWRRILEVLSFIHASGMVHGAILPPHLLIQENDHGVRLVGYSCAGRNGEKLRTVTPDSESFYPQPEKSSLTLTAPLDLAMSARCMAALLGGDPATTSLPAEVPGPLADLVQRIALMKPNGSPSEDAWTLREKLGKIAKEVFGPPQFMPIVMPD